MGVGVPSVKVIDGKPVETCIEIMLHLRNQIADERLQIGNATAVLRRDNKTELMRVFVRAAEKSGCIGIIAHGGIEFSSLALARDTVAQNIMEMCSGRSQVSRFDH